MKRLYWAFWWAKSGCIEVGSLNVWVWATIKSHWLNTSTLRPTLWSPTHLLLVIIGNNFVIFHPRVRPSLMIVYKSCKTHWPSKYLSNLTMLKHIENIHWDALRIETWSGVVRREIECLTCRFWNVTSWGNMLRIDPSPVFSDDYNTMKATLCAQGKLQVVKVMSINVSAHLSCECQVGVSSWLCIDRPRHYRPRLCSHSH